MRKLLTILPIFICYLGYGQITYTPMTGAGYAFKYLKADSGFAVPWRDLTTGRGVVRPGSIICNSLDSIFYGFNGVEWLPLGEGDGTTSIGKLDSVSINGNNLFYWTGGVGTAIQINKLDSVKQKAGTDSIFTYIGGVGTFAYRNISASGSVSNVTSGNSFLSVATGSTTPVLTIDTSKVHSYAYLQTQFAAVSHLHSAADITSGTLPIARGGTGLSGIGSVAQQIRVRSDGTALEYFTPEPTTEESTEFDSVFVGDDLYIDTLLNPGYQTIRRFHNDGLVSGGIVSWTGTGLTFSISPAIYYLNQVRYTTLADTITLDPADATNGRIDAFVVDTTQSIDKITGTASTDPVTPQEEPASQIVLATILLNAGDLTPSNIIVNKIFDENIEWTTTFSGTMVKDFDNTDNPYNGTKATRVTSYQNNSKLFFTYSGTETVQADQTLSLWFYSNGAFLNKLRFQFFNGSASASNSIQINSGFGLNPLDSNNYQNISIPISAFQFGTGVTTFNRLVISNVGSDNSGTKGYYIDNIQLQAGITNVPPPSDYSNKVDSVSIVSGSYYYWIKGIKYLIGVVPSGGGGETDTTSLSDRINLKLNISDTASMLNPYLRSNVATATYQPIGSYATTTDLALKVNISDTASMLSPYLSYQTPGALTDGATITWDLSVSTNASVTLAGNRTLAITNPVAGMYGTLVVTQDATGTRTLTLPAGSKVINGGAGAVTLTTTGAAKDILTFYYDGTNYYFNYGKNYN